METNQLIDNYYEELSKLRIELTRRIKESVKEDIILYNLTEDDNDKYYELPTFNILNKYNQFDTYSIIKVTKDLEIVGNNWESGDNYIQDISEISLDSLYDLYIELTKGN